MNRTCNWQTAVSKYARLNRRGMCVSTKLGHLGLICLCWIATSLAESTQPYFSCKNARDSTLLLSTHTFRHIKH